MTLRLYNTLTRRKQPFQPLDPAHVRMYVCGPTVYDSIHIGNARPLVVFDVLYRVLKRKYPKVTYVRNITDVDDKINARAKELGEDIREFTERTAALFHQDVAELGVLQPDEEPRATDHIEQMKAMIQKLLAAGHAYAADGHVLFHVPSMPTYGRLSRRNRDEMIAGARVEVAPYKKDPADFVLWKPSTEDLPGWDSPWGRGRPGWHLECSVMSEHFLGQEFDIHGGGVDLVFPHHENEIAQSCSANPGKTFARIWLHNGYLMAEGEKMSKSLGNFYTLRELLDRFDGEVLKLTLLQTQYRQPLDFTMDGVRMAQKRLNRLYRAKEKLEPRAEEDIAVSDESYASEDALSDDLNTPLAISQLEQQADRILGGNVEAGEDAYYDFVGNAGVLGLLDWDSNRWFRGGRDGSAVERIETLIDERAKAREAKDFARADEIREQLKGEGIVLEDLSGGKTNWRKAV
ncbi:MAG: cysteine--tRNA ligase [Alphaproteobacteria bacterium]